MYSNVVIFTVGIISANIINVWTINWWSDIDNFFEHDNDSYNDYDQKDAKETPRSEGITDRSRHFSTTDVNIPPLDTYVANIIANKVKLLCWIVTCPKFHMDRAIHIKETWGKRCDILLFMSTEDDPRLPTVKLNVPEGTNYLWGKHQAAARYIYDHYLHSADWFLRADDNTYVIVENLKHFLIGYNTYNPIYFGFRMKAIQAQNGFFSGGAGIVLSREAITQFVVKGLHNRVCNTSPSGAADDLDLTICLDKLGIIPMDSRDQYQRGRFHPFIPEHHIDATRNDEFWFWKDIYYEISLAKLLPGLRRCAVLAVPR
ncbi:glycoprotein-N-acetylgalactosamine 3-beta-galactosyltransferase 1-like isoform X2 [Plodia interpunctella]|uniref:glycoprotein-N-acetylgalactosamine 3-beta-galactosyltransferase 1-like isoform X2 n=1 Tax=Plodia interpunctella TaxID=58824 RepID=UPI0023686534|nr:glycoprotein-N-acetylgalactosamine 3-beta-galactosyltransferase 1-like isoform X2 [Plodia interpunctella]